MTLTNLNLEALLLFTCIIVWIWIFLFYFFVKDKKINTDIPYLDSFKVDAKLKKIKLLHTLKHKYISCLAIATSLICLAFVILWPKWWVETQISKAKWIDIMFALDVSKSMNALDFQNWNNLLWRIDAAKFMINDYISKNNQNRYWLVAFAWEAFSAIPITSDVELFSTFLNWINDSTVSKQWTNLLEAISSSLSRFVDSENNSKVVVLLSDWWDEDDENSYSTIKRIINENNVQIFTVWIWSVKWNFIPEWQDFFWRIKYKVFNGERVITKLNEYPLQKISKDSKWNYFHANSLSVISQINDEIKNLEKTNIEKNIWNDKKDLFRLFTWISFILFIIWIFIY